MAFGYQEFRSTNAMFQCQATLPTFLGRSPHWKQFAVLVTEQWPLGDLRARGSSNGCVHCHQLYRSILAEVTLNISSPSINEQQFSLPLVCRRPNVKKPSWSFLWKSDDFMHKWWSLWSHCAALGRLGCSTVNLQCFLDWKAGGPDFHLEESCKHLELCASILLFLLVAGFILKLKVQSRTQEEAVFLLRERFVSPYLSKPKHRCLIPRQMSMSAP